MALFKIGNQLEPIREKPFKLEKDIQELTENNIQTIFKLNLIASEFSINDFRIDSLAFDEEAKSFVIIEYKRGANFSVIDQGYAYLSIMLNNKADFILEYNETQKTTLSRNNIDWTQSRVIFIAPSFTKHQKEAINFKDLPIDLWTVRRFENDTVSFDPIKKIKLQETLKTIASENSDIEIITKEIKIYTESEHLDHGNDQIKELYEALKNRILNLGDIDLKPKKKYIAFIHNLNIVDIAIQQKALKIWINLKKGELKDPMGLTRDMSSTGCFGNGDYELTIDSDENIDYIIGLIKQSLNKKMA